MISIDVVSESNLWSKKINKPIIFFNSLVQGFPKKYKFSKKRISFTILLSNNKNIKKLNKKFRNKNKSTDVLSFPFYKKDELKKKIKKEKEVYLGDIVINLKKIKNKNNKFFFINNLNKLWIHGLVHLFGHRHKKDKDYYNMKKIEEKYLEYIS